MNTSKAKRSEFSPQSGRTRISRRFIAGSATLPPNEVRVADGRSFRPVKQQTWFSVTRSAGLGLFVLGPPSTKVPGYFQIVRFADFIGNCFMNNVGQEV
jgi:hypothetical protein